MRRISSLFILALLLFIAGCDDGGASKSDVKQPYGKPTKNVFTRMLYSGDSGMNVKSVIGRIVGTTTVNGTEYQRYLISHANTENQPDNIAATNTELWVSPFPMGKDGKVTIAGGNYHDSRIAGTVTPAFTIDMEAPIGEEQPVDTTYTGTLPDVAGNYTVAVQGTYKIVSHDESVATQAGTVNQCTHVTAAGTLTGDGLPAIVKDIPLTGEFWFHESFGVVKARIPVLGVDWSYEESWDVDDTDGEYRTIQRSGVVSDRKPVWTLSTYDVAGKYDADKMTHAKMLLEIRWAGDEMAKTPQMPGYPNVTVVFDTGSIYYFPHQFTESPISIFHPEDNGKGYRFYYAFVDEAAKNEPGQNGIEYRINISVDPSITADIKATGRIYYHTIEVP